MTEQNTLASMAVKNADNMAANAQSAFNNTVDRTAASIRPAFDHLVTGAHEAAERLSHAASQAAHKLELTGEQLKDAQNRATNTARGYVREKPLTAVGVAVASGFLLSWLLRQR